jgi:hypothetical protein
MMPKQISPTRDLVDIAVALERRNQDAKWGPQAHPDGTGSGAMLFFAEQAKEACDKAHRQGTQTWAKILEEEFWEALSETDPTKLRVELVQVMAVCKAWIQDIDSREPGTEKSCQAV